MTSVQGFDHVLPIVQQKVAAGLDAPKAAKGWTKVKNASWPRNMYLHNNLLPANSIPKFKKIWVESLKMAELYVLQNVNNLYLCSMLCSCRKWMRIISFVPFMLRTFLNLCFSKCYRSRKSFFKASLIIRTYSSTKKGNQKKIWKIFRIEVSERRVQKIIKIWNLEMSKA